MTGRIARLGIRWLPDAAPDEARLAHLVERFVAESLPDALEGVAGDELVCLRRVDVPARRFRWEDADDELLAGWADAVAAAVTSAARAAAPVRPGQLPAGAATAEAVRFRSLDVAVADLVAGVLSGRLDRAWAWGQLGLWPDDPAPAPPAGGPPAAVDPVLVAVAVEHLLVAPHLVLPALRAALGAGGHRVLAALSPLQLVRLVEGAWHAAGGVADDGPLPVEVELAVGRARAVLARSTVAAAGRAWLGSDLGAMPRDAVGAVAVAVAQLAVLEVEPAVACDGSTALVLELVADALVDAAGQPPATVPLAPGGGTVDTEADGPDARPEPVEPLRTAWAGLLFLLHLVPGAPTRTVLHLAGSDLLARLDADVAPDDPVLLAFAGTLGRGPAGPADEEDVVDAAALAVGLLASLLQRVPVDPPLPPDELLELVCRRDAVLEHDPGWVDVLLPLDEVVVEVRAAGLDLDPGHVPWLGCVVRFRYV